MKFSCLVEAAFYIPLLPAILAIFKWKVMKAHHKWFAILLWAIIIISFSGELWFKLIKDSNMPFFHSYILVEYLLLMQVFRYMFKEGIHDYIWMILIGGFSLVWLINAFVGKGWWAFPDYIHALEAVIIVALVIKWFLKMLHEKTIFKPAKTFEFWICAGLLIYFTGNFLLFLFPEFLISKSHEVFNNIWIMNCVLIMLLYFAYTIALLWVKKKVN